jgi:hypothetical protein
MRLRAAVLALRVVLILFVAAPALASPPVARPSPVLRALDAMMRALAPESARAGAAIRGLYLSHLDLLMLDEYAELTGALDNGGLVSLPDDPRRFNVMPRLDGAHPIGEKDLDNQTSYLAARTATIGALLDVASRVQSGPIEITSLVRHGDYQAALRTTNVNATTSVPMHTMGLAFDIALVNTRLETVHEIRDVLRKMQADGDILFVGERQQLVFHVAPHPSRLGHYADFYMQAMRGAPPTSRSAHVVAFSGGRRVTHGSARPTVTTDVLAMFPADGSLQALWTDQDAPLDVTGTTGESASAPVPAFGARATSTGVHRWIVLLAGLAATAWRITSRRPATLRVFDELR